MSSVDAVLHRSGLYAPGSSPRMLRKALAAGADAVILDLEDAVAPGEKPAARGHVAELLDEVAATPVAPDVHVRVNRSGDGWDTDDLAAVVRPGLDGLRLPKAETPEALTEVAALIDRLERDAGLPVGAIPLIPIIESAVGAVAITALATATDRVTRLSLGGADLLADLGGVGDDDLTTLHVRGELVLRSRAAGLAPPIDTVHTNLDDEEGLRAATRRARALGFYGKSLIHPKQIAPVHEVFTPSEDDVAWAERIVAAAAAAEAEGRGAVAIDGDFVDAPIVQRAETILALWRQR